MPSRNQSGIDALSFTNFAVTNSSTLPLDASAPTVVSASIPSTGTTIPITFSENLASATAAASDFTVLADGDTFSVLSTAVSTNKVTLTISGKISTGRTVTVSYAAPTASNSYSNSAVQDLQGNDSLSFSNLAVTNSSTVALDSTAPVISTAAVNSAGTLLTLTYTDADNLATITAPSSAYTVTRNGSAIAVSSIAISGKTVVLTLGSVIGSGQTVTLAYTAPDSSTSINNLAVQDLQGNDAASISPAMAVTNSSTQDKTPPALSSTAVSAGGIQITLTFNYPNPCHNIRYIYLCGQQRIDKSKGPISSIDREHCRTCYAGRCDC
jgi:uncharacterized repeat protein (TIGR02059 family)